MNVSDGGKLIRIILLIGALYMGNYLLSLGSGFSFEKIFTEVIIFPFGILAIVVHEVSHGYMAYFLGDPTAKLAGRLSLNPLRHFDPVGVLSMMIFRIGWAKPVPVDFRLLRNVKRDTVLVALAGPLSNLALAFIFAVVAGWLVGMDQAGAFKGEGTMISFSTAKMLFEALVVGGIQINLMLMVFNLIPIPPLDGSRVLASLAPRSVAKALYEMESYGFILVIALVYFNVLTPVILWPVNAIFSWMYRSIVTG